VNRAGEAVVVTGLGVVSAAGAGVDALWRAVGAGQPLAQWLEPDAVNPGARVAGCAVPVLDGLPPRAVRGLPRVVKLAGRAVREAWDDACFPPGSLDASRTGVVAGSSRGTFEAMLEADAAWGRRRLRPIVAGAGSLGSLSGALAGVVDARGWNLTVSSACVSGTSAIALASEELRAGRADVMVAGGADTGLHRAVVAQFDAAGLLGTADTAGRVCRPFAADRDGTVLGEGAAFLVLERESHARARGARIRARLSGWALACDAGRRTGMSADAALLADVAASALGMAGVGVDQVGYVNLHGTGTQVNDAAEAEAVARWLGARASAVPVSCVKPVTGHCLGASSAMEALLCVRSVETGTVPPQPHAEGTGAGMGLRFAAPGERVAGPALVSVSSGFWGNCGALVVTPVAG
jgi:3-oxoacyl-[acyl-carrier-protein] synthase II